MSNTYSYEFPRPALTVDGVVFGFDGESLKVLLIERSKQPHGWALPGGFVRMEESLDAAAERELCEETGLRNVFLEQLYTFGNPHRDPRERVVTVAYFALVKLLDHRVKADTDARNAAWYKLSELPRLEFDHGQIIKVALERLRGKVRYVPIGFELLPPTFALSQLQLLYETILERRLDKRNFRKKVLALGLLDDTKKMQSDVAHRAAKLYQFNSEAYERLKRNGVDFEL